MEHNEGHHQQVKNMGQRSDTTKNGMFVQNLKNKKQYKSYQGSYWETDNNIKEYLASTDYPLHMTTISHSLHMSGLWGKDRQNHFLTNHN